MQPFFLPECQLSIPAVAVSASIEELPWERKKWVICLTKENKHGQEVNRFQQDCEDNKSLCRRNPFNGKQIGAEFYDIGQVCGIVLSGRLLYCHSCKRD